MQAKAHPPIDHKRRAGGYGVGVHLSPGPPVPRPQTPPRLNEGLFPNLHSTRPRVLLPSFHLLPQDNPLPRQDENIGALLCPLQEEL